MNLLGDGAKPWKAVLSSDGLSDVGIFVKHNPRKRSSN